MVRKAPRKWAQERFMCNQQQKRSSPRARARTDAPGSSVELRASVISLVIRLGRFESDRLVNFFESGRDESILRLH